MSKIYLISESTLKKHSLINNNLDGQYITSIIDICQNIDLDTLIGTALLNKICDLVDSGDIQNPDNIYYKNLLDLYITEYLVWQVMSLIQIALNYKITNSGVIENQDDKKSRLDYSNSRAIQSLYEHYAAAYANKMKNFILKNVIHFPEYKKCINYEVAEDVNTSGIYFPNIKFCRK